MNESENLARLEAVATGGPYHVSAYLWVLRVLEETRRKLEREDHITAVELLEGNLELARREFGPMALEVFTHWGLETTSDIGSIVFELVESGFLRKTDDDSIDDFDDVHDLQQALIDQYEW